MDYPKGKITQCFTVVCGNQAHQGCDAFYTLKADNEDIYAAELYFRKYCGWEIIDGRWVCPKCKKLEIMNENENENEKVPKQED